MRGVSSMVQLGENPTPRKPMRKGPPAASTCFQMPRASRRRSRGSSQRRARELELATGLERHGAAHLALAVGPLQGDDVLPLHDRLPAEAGDQPFHEGAHAALALVGNGDAACRCRTGTSRARCRCAKRAQASSPPRSGDEVIARAHGWGRCAVLAGGHWADRSRWRGSVPRWHRGGTLVN